MMTLEFHCATDTGRARTTTRTRSPSTRPRRWSCWPTAWAATTPAKSPAACAPRSSRPSSAAGCRKPSESATDTDVRRAMDICVDNANRAIFNAANSNPQYAGMGTTLVVGVFRENRLLLGHVGDSRCYRHARGPADADHARPLAAAGADRRRPDHRRAGGVLVEQEPGDARGRGRGHGAARDPPARRAARRRLPAVLGRPLRHARRRDDRQLLQSCELLPEAATALIDAANEAGGKDNISVVLVRVRGPCGCGAIVVAVPPLTPCRAAGSSRQPGAAHTRQETRGLKHGQTGRIARRCRDQGSADHEGQDDARPPPLQRHRDRQPRRQRRARRAADGRRRRLHRRPQQHQRHLHQRQGRQEAAAGPQRHGRDRQVQDQVHGRGRHRLREDDDHEAGRDARRGAGRLRGAEPRLAASAASARRRAAPASARRRSGS